MKHLTKLSTMLKKRGRKDFRSELRQKIQRQANQAMHSEKSPTWAERFAAFMGHRRALSAVTFAVLLAFTALIVNPFQGNNALPQLVNVAEAKDYYQLTPLDSDESGIGSTTSFKLTSKGEISVKSLEKVVEMTPAVDLKFSQNSPNEVTITPAKALNSGEIYKIALNAQDLKDSPFQKTFDWAYQVSSKLRITGTLPGNEGTGVPTNSGIEVYFNTVGVSAEDFEKNFKVSPAVSGRFEVNGKTGIFIPNKLRDKTIYTVTIGSELGITGSENHLAEEYSFQFETKSEEESANIHLNFQTSGSVLEEFRPDQEVELAMYASRIAETQEGVAELYKYRNPEDAIKDIQDENTFAPRWSMYAKNDYKIKTLNMDLVNTYEGIQLMRNEQTPINLGTQSEGIYLLQVTVGDQTEQQMIQVSNTATYINVSTNGSLAWVNDMAKNAPLNGAEVSVYGEKVSVNTNKEGVAELAKFDLEANERINKILTVTANGRETIYPLEVYSQGQYAAENAWGFLKTDRSTYQSDDSVSYWGMLKGREKKLSGSAEIFVTDSFGYIYDWSEKAQQQMADNILYSKTINIEDAHAFDGKIDLEKYKTGYYAIAIVQGDKLLANTNFSVENYIKPAYKINYSSDKTLVFEGDTINAEVSASFFEGTPVSNTDFRLTLPGDTEKVLTSNERGLATYSFVANTVNDSYCETSKYCNFLEYQTLSVKPVNEELSDITANGMVRVLRSSVDVSEEKVDRDGIHIELQNVDPSIVKSQYANMRQFSDIYSGPAAGAKVEFSVVRQDETHEKIGTYYDNFSKTVKNQYQTTYKETVVDTFTLTSNEDGVIEKTLGNLDDHKTYFVTYKVYDSQNRYFKSSSFLPKKSADSTFFTNQSPYLSIEDSKSGHGFNIGETVKVNLENYDEQDGQFLFILSHQGIQTYQYTNTPHFEFKFDKKYMPNVFITVAGFDGKGFNSIMGSAASYDSSLNELEIGLKTDKDSYKPGDTVVLDINTEGNSEVYLNMVDEAFYSLYPDYFMNPLDQLFGPVQSGTQRRYFSHISTFSDDGGKGGCFVAGTKILMADGSLKNIEDIVAGDMILTRENPFSNTLVPGEVKSTVEHEVGEYLLINGELGVTGEHVVFANGQWNLASKLKVGDQMLNDKGDVIIVESIEILRKKALVYNFEVDKYHTYFANGYYVHNDKGDVREDFKDTGLAELVETDANGHATVNFELPDNITSWRLTASAVKGQDLKAGFETTNINVSKALFALPVVNTEYLTGDKPSIPVRAFGSALSDDYAVKFTIESDTLNHSEAKTGVAFKNTYFDLPSLPEGEHNIVTSAEIDNDRGDSIRSSFSVKNSHLKKDEIWEDELSEKLKISGASDARTDITFMNKEVGQIYPLLTRGIYEHGDRIDQKVYNTVSLELLNQYFGGSYEKKKIPYDLYQNDDGGISLLPYSDSDLTLTAQLAALNADLWNKTSLSRYFDSIVGDKSETLSRKIVAIYGLSSLGESALSELNYFAQNKDLSLEDKIYAALAYSTYGAGDKATDLFVQITGNIKKTGSGTKVTTDGASTDNELSWTALTATLADEIGATEVDGLWNFVINNDNYRAKDRIFLVHLEKLLYAKSKLERGAQSKVSFRLNGKKVTLEKNNVYRISVTPEERKALKFDNISGEIQVLSFFQTPLNLEKTDTNKQISISRKYLVDGKETTNLKPGDLVKVQIDMSTPANLSGSYRVTDYLPSGLKLVSSPVQFRYMLDGKGSNNRIMYPYETVRQESSFYISCPSARACSKSFYYLARVINKGTFKLEPATIQSFTYTDRFNVSGGRAELVIE